jgi:hypothetical protein
MEKAVTYTKVEGADGPGVGLDTNKARTWKYSIECAFTVNDRNHEEMFRRKFNTFLEGELKGQWHGSARWVITRKDGRLSMDIFINMVVHNKRTAEKLHEKLTTTTGAALALPTAFEGDEFNFAVTIDSYST